MTGLTESSGKITITDNYLQVTRQAINIVERAEKPCLSLYNGLANSPNIKSCNWELCRHRFQNLNFNP